MYRLTYIHIYLQKENLSLAFKTGETVGIAHTLVSKFVFFLKASSSLAVTVDVDFKPRIFFIEIVFRQTVEEMLRTGGPDWQRVLSYVESIYRHFEM